jgi:hypothetical protein
MVEKEKTMKYIEDKKKRKRSSESQEQNSSSTQHVATDDHPKEKKPKRNFKQIKSIDELVRDKSRVSQSLVKSVFSKKARKEES